MSGTRIAADAFGNALGQSLGENIGNGSQQARALAMAESESSSASYVGGIKIPASVAQSWGPQVATVDPFARDSLDFALLGEGEKGRLSGTTIGPRTYVVQEGDNLSRISNRAYGDPNQWAAIMAANPEITDPSLIRRGMELAIPEAGRFDPRAAQDLAGQYYAALDAQRKAEKVQALAAAQPQYMGEDGLRIGPTRERAALLAAQTAQNALPVAATTDQGFLARQASNFLNTLDSGIESFKRGYAGPRSVMDDPATALVHVGDLAREMRNMIPGYVPMNSATANFSRGNYGTAAIFGIGALAEAALAIGTGGESVAVRQTANAGAREYGVTLFGESNLGYYTRETATIGREGKSFFFMPAEDAGVVKNAADAARYTGRSPSTEAAYLQGGDIFGLSFPTNGMKVSLPTAADAGGWPHFLEGGHTAVRLSDGPGAGYLVNPTREFIVPGGSVVPVGSVLFKIGPSGEWVPIRRF
jgi:hypothetical protein